MIYLGSHLNLSGPYYYLGTCQKAIEYNETSFMFYSGAPQNTIRIPTSKMKIAEGRKFLQAHNFDESKIVIHAPYIINLANQENEKTYLLGRSFLQNEILRAKEFCVQNIVLHPGSSLKNPPEFGITSLVNALNYIFSNDTTNITICLETMAGKGSEIGRTFNELGQIIARINNKNRIGICLDTCHINDAGYDVNDIDGVLAEFEKEIGLSYLRVIHLNDSKNSRSSHKDRHENIGYGTIGFTTLYKWANHPKLDNIPKILETPYVDSKAPYKEEIKMLRSGNYSLNWKENL